MLKLAIFDVDGTLVDSQAIIVASMQAGHEAAGLTMPERARVLSIVGLSLDVALRTLHPGVETGRLGRLADGYRDAYATLRAEGATPLFPGARAALDRLEAAGWLLAIATGKGRRGLDHILDEHALAGRFVALQTADDAPSKPHPAMVENLLAETGVEPGHAVMIGDTSYDIAMARAARAGALGVGWGHHPASALREAGAHDVVDAFDAVDTALEAALAAMQARPA